MKRQKLLITSLIINFGCILFLGVLYFKSTSIQELSSKVLSIFNHNQNVTASYYLEKTDQFKTFNISKNNIVFLGDSITDMGDWNQFFPNEKVVNMGINSDTIQGVINRLGIVTRGKPSKIFIMIGTNDLSGNTSAKSLALNYKKMIYTIKSQSPSSKIYIQSVLPINDITWEKSSEVAFHDRKESNQKIKQFNGLIKKISDDTQSTFIDLYPLFSDSSGNMDMKYSFSGLHLNGEGYKVWAKVISKYVVS